MIECLTCTQLPLAQRMGIRPLAREYTTVVVREWW
jgi:hypothetical protein